MHEIQIEKLAGVFSQYKFELYAKLPDGRIV
jgi:hypothetical protein